MLSWILTTYLGRRTIYVWGSLINVVFLIALGIAGSVGKSTASSLAMASLGLIVSVGFTLGPAPASWVIIAETSAIRLRPLTTGLGRAAYYIVNIPCIFLSTYMLNSTVRFPFFSPKLPKPCNKDPSPLTNKLIIGCEPWWQVRLRLGCHRFRLLRRRILLLAGDEGSVCARDRHPVQASCSSSPVEEDRHRHQRRRIVTGLRL